MKEEDIMALLMLCKEAKEKKGTVEVAKSMRRLTVK